MTVAINGVLTAVHFQIAACSAYYNMYQSKKQEHKPKSKPLTPSEIKLKREREDRSRGFLVFVEHESAKQSTE